MGRKAGPPPDLALESVGSDDDVRADVEPVPHVLTLRPDYAAVFAKEVDRARLDHHVRTRLRGFLRQMAVEKIPLEDVTAFVAGPVLIQDEGGPVRCDDPRTVHFMANELTARRETNFLQPALRHAFSAANRRANFGALLDQEHLRAASGGVLRGRTPGRPCPDDEDVNFTIHLACPIPWDLMSLWATPVSCMFAKHSNPIGER